MQDHYTSIGSQSNDIEAAHLLLARMGLSLDDLMTHQPSTQPAPTFAEYIPRVSDAVSQSTRRAYTPYWTRILDAWGQRRLDEPNASDIKRLAEHTRSQITPRRNSRGGRSAVEHLIAALRCLYTHAVADGLLSEAHDPSRRVSKPRRLPTTRRALTDKQMVELNRVAASTGNDPALDALLLRLHTETACRRGGVLALRPCDLDPNQCLIRLREKGETIRWQPISPTLMTHLRSHTQHRGTSDPHQPLLRNSRGCPMSRRRYDRLWARLGDHLPWVATQQITTHWLRHTTLTWVERHFGYAVAREYAGHTNSGDTGATATYVRAGLHEVATALAALTGEHHPLATDP